jgi:hypothetical protein
VLGVILFVIKTAICFKTISPWKTRRIIQCVYAITVPCNQTLFRSCKNIVRKDYSLTAPAPEDKELQKVP